MKLISTSTVEITRSSTTRSAIRPRARRSPPHGDHRDHRLAPVDPTTAAARRRVRCCPSTSRIAATSAHSWLSNSITCRAPSRTHAQTCSMHTLRHSHARPQQPRPRSISLRRPSDHRLPTRSTVSSTAHTSVIQQCRRLTAPTDHASQHTRRRDPHISDSASQHPLLTIRLVELVAPQHQDHRMKPSSVEAPVRQYPPNARSVSQLSNHITNRAVPSTALQHHHLRIHRQGTHTRHQPCREQISHHLIDHPGDPRSDHRTRINAAEACITCRPTPTRSNNSRFCIQHVLHSTHSYPSPPISRRLSGVIAQPAQSSDVRRKAGGPNPIDRIRSVPAPFGTAAGERGDLNPRPSGPQPDALTT